MLNIEVPNVKFTNQVPSYLESDSSEDNDRQPKADLLESSRSEPSLEPQNPLLVYQIPPQARRRTSKPFMRVAEVKEVQFPEKIKAQESAVGVKGVLRKSLRRREGLKREIDGGLEVVGVREWRKSHRKMVDFEASADLTSHFRARGEVYVTVNKTLKSKKILSPSVQSSTIVATPQITMYEFCPDMDSSPKKPHAQDASMEYEVAKPKQFVGELTVPVNLFTERSLSKSPSAKTDQIANLNQESLQNIDNGTANIKIKLIHNEVDQ
jgi:hypothetical protein